MVDRLYIDRILKINGIDLKTPLEQVRALLQNTGITDEDIAAWSTQVPQEQNVERTNIGVQTLFKTDNSLQPSDISSLLGITMMVTELPQKKQSFFKQKSIIVLHTICVVFFIFLFASLSIVTLMWFTHTGLFHLGTIVQ